MKVKLKKSKVLLIVVVLLLQLVLPVVWEMVLTPKTFAAIEGDYEYTVAGGTATIDKYNGSATVLNIPSTLRRVSSINNRNRSILSQYDSRFSNTRQCCNDRRQGVSRL